MKQIKCKLFNLIHIRVDEEGREVWILDQYECLTLAMEALNACLTDGVTSYIELSAPIMPPDTEVILYSIERGLANKNLDESYLKNTTVLAPDKPKDNK
jgi:hypothetical protein